MTLQSRYTNKINKVAQADTTRLINKITRTYDHSIGTLKNVMRLTWHVESVNRDKPYQVQLEWIKEDEQLVIKTRLNSHNKAIRPVNLSHTISYHILGVIKKMATDKGKIIKFRSTQANAKKCGGQVIRIDNLSGGSIWASYK